MIPGLHQIELRVALLAVVLGVVLEACTSAANPTCASDARSPGYLPDLERGLSALRLDEKPPTTVDSGQNCSPGALGSFARHGIDSIIFAGATWDLGGGAAVTIARIARSDSVLPVSYVEEFYEMGAREGRKTSHVEVSGSTVEGIGPVFRVDALNDLSLQTVLVWEGTGEANVALVATPVGPTAVRAEHDALVDRALAAAVSSAR